MHHSNKLVTSIIYPNPGSSISGVFLWDVHIPWFQMLFSCESPMFPQNFPWTYRNVPMVFHMCFFSVREAFPSLFSNVSMFSMVFPYVSMVFPWFSQVFPTFFHAYNGPPFSPECRAMQGAGPFMGATGRQKFTAMKPGDRRYDDFQRCLRYGMIFGNYGNY